MKTVYLSLIFFSFYTHMHAMDIEAEQDTIREYNDARSAYDHENNELKILILKQPISHNGHTQTMALDPDCAAAKHRLHIAALYLKKCEKRMRERGYLK